MRQFRDLLNRRSVTADVLLISRCRCSKSRIRVGGKRQQCVYALPALYAQHALILCKGQEGMLGDALMN